MSLDEHVTISPSATIWHLAILSMSLYELFVHESDSALARTLDLAIWWLHQLGEQHDLALAPLVITLTVFASH